MKTKYLQFIIFSFLLGTLAFPIIVTDTLERGKFYQLRFKVNADKESSRYVGLYTQKTLDADMLIFDDNEKLLAKIQGTGGKYPNTFSFPKSGIYSAKVVAYSGEGPFFMLISDKDELKKVLKDVK